MGCAARRFFFLGLRGSRTWCIEGPCGFTGIKGFQGFIVSYGFGGVGVFGFMGYAGFEGLWWLWESGLTELWGLGFRVPKEAVD